MRVQPVTSSVLIDGMCNLQHFPRVTLLCSGPLECQSFPHSVVFAADPVLIGSALPCMCVLARQRRDMRRIQGV